MVSAWYQAPVQVSISLCLSYCMLLLYIFAALIVSYFHSLKVLKIFRVLLLRLIPMIKVSEAYALYIAVKITSSYNAYTVVEAALVPDPDQADQLLPAPNGTLIMLKLLPVINWSVPAQCIKSNQRGGFKVNNYGIQLSGTSIISLIIQKMSVSLKCACAWQLLL